MTSQLKLVCKCGHEFCGHCSEPWHEDLDCEQAIGSFRKYTKKSVTQRCPHCLTHTENAGGCERMTCYVCKGQWCWNCGGARSDTRTHYCKKPAYLCGYQITPPMYEYEKEPIACLICCCFPCLLFIWPFYLCKKSYQVGKKCCPGRSFGKIIGFLAVFTGLGATIIGAVTGATILTWAVFGYPAPQIGLISVVDILNTPFEALLWSLLMGGTHVFACHLSKAPSRL